ncbi:hypothetical protein Tco_0571623 [Tanacetum coccineum]
MVFRSCSYISKPEPYRYQRNNVNHSLSMRMGSIESDLLGVLRVMGNLTRIIVAAKPVGILVRPEPYRYQRNDVNRSLSMRIGSIESELLGVLCAMARVSSVISIRLKVCGNLLDAALKPSPRALLGLPASNPATTPPQEIRGQTPAAMTPTTTKPAYPSTKDSSKGSEAHSKATKKTARRELFKDTEATEKEPRQES